MIEFSVAFVVGTALGFVVGATIIELRNWWRVQRRLDRRLRGLRRQRVSSDIENAIRAERARQDATGQ